MDKIKLDPELQAKFDELKAYVTVNTVDVGPNVAVRERFARLRALIESNPANGAIERIAAPFSPATLAAAQSAIQVRRWPAAFLVVTITDLNTLATSDEFATWFDPISKYELVRAGYIGCVLGLEVFTDAFDAPDEKWVQQSMMCGGPAFMGL